MNPKVSIIIPVYNGANFVAEAIESALAQTYKNIEIIVVNDGSTDDGATERAVLAYGDRVRYIAKENGGVSTALNRGIKEMTGDYFSWLSHDDLYKPDKIEKQVSLLENEKDIALCDGLLMYADGCPMAGRTKLLNKKLSGHELFSYYLKGYHLNGLGFLIPKTAFDKVGLFDEDMRCMQDLDMWLRMMWHDYRFICHPNLLVVTRVHAAQTTNRLKSGFSLDSGTLAKKHATLLKDADVSEKEKLLCLYLSLYTRANNQIGIELFKPMLKDAGIYRKAIFPCFMQKIKGGTKRRLRRVKNSLLRLKKIRD